MRYLRAIGDAVYRSQPSVFTPYRPRNIRICIRYGSTAASTILDTSNDLTRLEIFGGKQALDMEKVDTTERLTRLRELMKKHKVDIYSM